MRKILALATTTGLASLANQYFTSGVAVNNRISSHRWVWSGCGVFLDS
ncbi:hypothetical protein [Streptomyces sp. NPDC101178]